MPDALYVFKSTEKMLISEVAQAFCVKISDIINVNRQLTNPSSVGKDEYLLIPIDKADKKCLKAAGSSIEEKKKLLIKYSKESWQYILILRMIELKSFKINSDKLIAQAVENIRTILGSDSQCAKFFGANASEALNVMESRLKSTSVDNSETSPLGIEMKSPQTFTVDGVVKYVIYLEEDVNSRGPFYNSKSKARLGNYTPNTNRSRALQILHELGHAVYKNGQPLIPVDGNNVSLSEKNTTYLLDNQDCECRAEIDKIKD